MNVLKSPSVTIVSVFYNRQGYIEKSVSSLLEQTYENIRIILVDDGSTDNTYSELSRFCSESVEVVTHENMGFTKSIASILSGVNSDYIAIHGSGDISYADRVRKQVCALERDREALLCGVASYNLHHETFDRIDLQSFPRERVFVNDFFKGTPFTHGSVLYRTVAYKKHGGYDPRFVYSQDWDLWLRMLKDGSYALFIPEVLYSRINFPSGASNSAKKSVSQFLHVKAIHYLYQNPSVDRSWFLKEGITLEIFSDDKNLKNELAAGLSRRALRLSVNGMKSESSDLIEYIHELGLSPRLMDIYLIYVFDFMGRLGISGLKLSSLLRKIVNLIRYWR